MTGVRVERRLAAILAADVAGYSRLMEADENGTFARLKRLRLELVEPILIQHGGRVVDLKGDGAIVEFQSAVDAVEAAVAVQRAMATQDADLAERQRIRFRIGINLGDVIVDGTSIYGDGVNVAARIEALCEPGGVWLSRSVHNQVKGKLALAFAASGLHQVKNISEAVETFRVELDGVAPAPPTGAGRYRWHRPVLAAACIVFALVFAAGVWRFWPTEPPPGKPSIAVLPFENYGGDEATARLADGITEDIITDLARFSDLDVIARNLTEIYKGKPVDVREVGRDLHVGYVLEGSIQRQGDQVRVTAQLIDARSGAHVWAERWDRPMGDVFAVQTEIAQTAASKVGDGSGVAVTAGAEAAKRKRPEALTAYELYLLGMATKHRETAADVEQAIGLLKQSLAIDPGFARAWAALAWSYQLLQALTADSPELQQLRLEAATKAIELDPADAEAHAAMGFIVATTSGDLARAEAELDLAVRLNPSSADVLAMYSAWGSAFGKPDLGIAVAERAMRLNPNLPPWALGNFAYAYFMVGDYREALLLLERKPRDTFLRYDYVYRAASLAELGRAADARAAVAETLAVHPGLSIEGFAVLDPAWSDAERARLVATMRVASFPACAAADAWAQAVGRERLPECMQT